MSKNKVNIENKAITKSPLFRDGERPVDKVEHYYKVTKSNILIDAVYSLSSNEQKILITAISLLNSKETKDYTSYRISISALKEILKINSNDFHRQMKLMSFNILSKPFWYYDEETKKTLQGSWFSTCEYCDGEGIVEFEFSTKIKKLLLGLKKNFTSYMLGYAVSLKSRFSIRMYEILKKIEDMKSVIFYVDELKKVMEIEGKYKQYNHFKMKVLEKAKDEINRHTDIRFRYVEVKSGRRVDRIKFIVSQNKKNIEPIKKPDLFGMNETSIRLEEMGMSRDKAIKIINQYDDDYISDRIEQFMFDKKHKEEQVLKIGTGKYIYNLITHPEWKDDKYELYKSQLKRKQKEKEEKKERQRVEKEQKEYEEYIESLTPLFESLPLEEMENIEREIEKQLKSTLTSSFKLSEETIENLRGRWKKEIIQSNVKQKHPYKKWVEDR